MQGPVRTNQRIAHEQHRSAQLRANATSVRRVRLQTERMPDNQLQTLQNMSKVVADTGDFTQIQQYKPYDCTTNPSLLLQVIDLPEYEDIIKKALQEEKEADLMDPDHPYAGVADRIAVGIGMRMLDLIPGRISTECDARLAYDTQATIEKGRRLVGLYAARGVHVDRLYIKIASTWEGVLAAEQLQREGISTNMTLLFDFCQAVACAQAKASLISPFVGRIMDWYKAKEGRDFAPEEDPGVISVKRIFNYYKKYRIPTIVMAASFRNVGEIQQLAGCDNLTIAPKLLKELAELPGPIERALDGQLAHDLCEDSFIPKIDEEMFRKMLGENQMATEKLAEGVSKFAADQDKCEARIAERAAEWGMSLV